MKRRSRKSKPFKPTRAEINEAIHEFLARGGKIKKLVVDENTQVTNLKWSSLDAYEFLSN